MDQVNPLAAGQMTNGRFDGRAAGVGSGQMVGVGGVADPADVTSEVQVGPLHVDTSDLRLIGDVALRAGLPVHELRHSTTDLEALFFELTEGTNRNLRAVPDAAPPERDAVATQEGANG